MPDTGSPYNLRYPALADTPNVPRDIENLADDVHAELATVDASIATTNTEVASRTKRVGTATLTTDSSGWDDSPEVQAMSITVPLVSGKTYRITLHCNLASSVAADQHFIRIREDSLSGTVLTLQRYRAHTVDNYPFTIEVEYTAVSTGNKTFVIGGARESGTGLGRIEASATNTAYLYVDYVRG